MQFYSNTEIANALTLEEATGAIEAALRAQARGAASQQARARTECGGCKISTMAAVLEDLGVAGAKVYTTVEGRFRFVVLLFSAHTGEPLACMDADALTAIRTPAATLIAARRLASPSARTMGVFGTGVQAKAHVDAFVRSFAIEEVRVWGIEGQHAFAEGVRSRHGISATASSQQDAAASEILVLATRAKEPVLDGAWLRPGTFVAALGATLPTHREINDAVLDRAACVCVEWREQAFSESGDLILAANPGQLRNTAVELGALIEQPGLYTRRAADVTLYKAVGIALEDVALAAAAHERLARDRHPFASPRT